MKGEDDQLWSLYGKIFPISVFCFEAGIWLLGGSEGSFGEVRIETRRFSVIGNTIQIDRT